VMCNGAKVLVLVYAVIRYNSAVIKFMSVLELHMQNLLSLFIFSLLSILQLQNVAMETEKVCFLILVLFLILLFTNRIENMVRLVYFLLALLCCCILFLHSSVLSLLCQNLCNGLLFLCAPLVSTKVSHVGWLPF
jgi:hypothetical protein